MNDALPAARKPSLLEVLAVIAFFALVLLLGARIVSALGGRSAWLVLAMLALGYIAADFVSGLVHWAFDTWGATTTPVLGPAFIVPFRVHHSDPEDITRHGFVATNGHNCFASLPVLVGSFWLPVGTAFGDAALAFVTSLCFGVFCTNQFHKWAHQKQVGAVVGWLQRRGIILNPDHHQIHHTAPFEHHYCITTGWLNRPLRAIGFFRGMERLVHATTRAVPRRDDLGIAVPHPSLPQRESGT